jgi:uncharacterized protein (DUF1330 family)
VSIEPTPEQLQRLSASDDADPVVMLNLLRFKARADGIDAADQISGAEAYQRYAVAAGEFLVRAGGRVLFAGDAQESVIGPEEGEWDLLLCVQYPSRQAFLTMISDPAYLKISRHRTAALADSRLVACRQMRM